MIGDQEKPVAAPRDVAGDGADAGHVDRRPPSLSRQLGTLVTETSPSGCSSRGDDADGRIDPMRAGADPPEVRERGHEADRAVAAHADVADVVEEDHAGGARGVLRRDEQRAHQHVRAARLVDDRGAEPVELAPEALAPRGERARSEIGAAGDDHARRLASGMRIDDFDPVHGCLAGRARAGGLGSPAPITYTILIQDRCPVPVRRSPPCASTLAGKASSPPSPRSSRPISRSTSTPPRASWRA